MSSSWRERYERSRFEQEEAAEREAKAAPILTQTAAVMQRLIREQRELMKLSWGGDQFAGPDRATKNPDSYKDEGFDAVPEGKNESWQAVKSACETWGDSLLAKTGYTLSVRGIQRVAAYGITQGFFGKKMDSPEAWQAAFDRLFECGAIPEADLGFDDSRITERPAEPAPTPEKLPTIDDIEGLDTVSREGLKQSRKIVEEIAAYEQAPMVIEWLDSLKNNFNGFVPTPPQLKTVQNWFQRNNRSFADRRNYDAARRAMVAQGLWPERLLTPEDLLAREIESTPLSTSGFDARQALIRRIRRD